MTGLFERGAKGLAVTERRGDDGCEDDGDCRRRACGLMPMMERVVFTLENGTDRTVRAGAEGTV
jgi:hypothetical protein